jgi:hypothetical protein
VILFCSRLTAMLFITRMPPTLQFAGFTGRSQRWCQDKGSRTCGRDCFDGQTCHESFVAGLFAIKEWSA